MVDRYGLMPENYVIDLARARTNNYIHTAIVTLLAYDTIYLFPQEVKYIYQGSWSRVYAIYLAIRLSAWFSVITEFYTWGNTFLSIQWCSVVYEAMFSVAGQVLLPVVMKVLLVLRLRAAWNNNRFVTIILYILSGAEILIGLASAMFTIYTTTLPGALQGGYPLHGCFSTNSESIVIIYRALNKVEGTFVVVQTISTLAETILTLIKFVQTYRETKAAASTIHERISHLQVCTPLLYVFYRDGTLLYVPVLLFSLLELVVMFNLLPPSAAAVLNYIDWSIWGEVLWSMIVSRLILNVREAGCSFRETLLSRPIHSTIQFHLPANPDGEDSTHLEEFDDAHEGIQYSMAVLNQGA